ncbi:MAG: hypothetical protein J6A59_01370 [Lachnospiraceae bacterium]|nr:hypothetical protein [Lachnospiraceae bacterium]
MKRRLLSMLLLVTLISCVTGCEDKDQDPLLSESKETLVAAIHSYEDDIAGLITEVEDLEIKLKGVTGEDVPPEAISTIGDGTGRLSFNSYKDTITFPELLMYPEALSTPALNDVYITDNVSFTPTANWVMKLDGTTTELEYTDEITGTIKVVAYDTMYDIEILKARLQEWVDTLPPDEKMQWTKMFVADNFCGYDILSKESMIDAEPAVVRIGMFAYGQKAVSYAFVYRGENSPLKDEAIKNIITSIEINKHPLEME